MSTIENEQATVAPAKEVEKVSETLPEVEEEEEEIPFEELLETAKRHFALKEWAEAADGFGQALESM